MLADAYIILVMSVFSDNLFSIISLKYFYIFPNVALTNFANFLEFFAKFSKLKHWKKNHDGMVVMTFYLHQNGRTHLNCFYKKIWEEEKWKKIGRKAYIKAKEKAMNFSSFTLDFQNSLSIVQYWKSSIQTTVILQQVSQLPKRKRKNSFDWPLYLPVP